MARNWLPSLERVEIVLYSMDEKWGGSKVPSYDQKCHLTLAAWLHVVR
jgi:hypothetical protein